MRSLFFVLPFLLGGCEQFFDAAQPQPAVCNGCHIACASLDLVPQILVTDANHLSHSQALVTAVYDSQSITLFDDGDDKESDEGGNGGDGDVIGTYFGTLPFDGTTSETFTITVNEAGYQPLTQTVQMTVTLPSNTECASAQIQNGTLVLLPL